MTSQTARDTFSRLSFLLLCGLSGLLVFHGGCAIVGSSDGLGGAKVTGGTSCVGNCTIISQQISPQTIKDIEALGLTKAALNQFLNDLGRNKTSPEALDHELRDIAKNYLDLKTKIATFSSEDPQVTALIQQARQAVEAVNFPLAERLFNEASQRDEQAAQHLQQVSTTRLTSAAAAQAANGDLQVVQLNFVNAQAYYRKALQLLPPSDREHQGPYLILLGISLQEAGIRTKGADIEKFLSEAVQAYRDVLTIYTKEQLPQQWAMAQNNLGNVLGNQGVRMGGVAGTRLLAEAVTAYRAALTVRTKEQLPQDWAATQNNLGNVLGDQGIRTGGETGTRLLAEAVQAHRAALTVYTKDQLPQQWAATQNNLGTVLRDEGIRTAGEAGTQLLAEAVTAYRAALRVHTKEHPPQDWATTQNNLGIVLGDQGIRIGREAGTRLLAEAVQAYRAALTVYTKEQLSQDWAMTQNNLGNVLSKQGTRTGGEVSTQLLAEAVAAYRAALTVYTKEQLPQGWATTQNNLGTYWAPRVCAWARRRARN